MPLEIAFQVLGPVRALINGEELVLGGRRHQVLLAVLLIHLGNPVEADRLIDALWAEDPPASAGSTLRTHLSRIRSLFGSSELIVHTGSGYSLQIEPETVDSVRFSRLAAEGRQALRSGDLVSASRRLGEGLELWRGPAFGVLADVEAIRLEAARLEALKLAALEDRIDADLGLGRHHELVEELERLTGEYPFREHLRGQLMTALYRAGRQAEALRAYQDARRLLGEELGIEPGPALQRLEEAILLQDPDLEPGPSARPARHNLPVPLTSFVGRAQELDAIRQLLTTVRLLTLTGPGGSGKTRLALEATTGLIEHYQHGVTWVDLGPLDDPGLVPAQVASALGLRQTAVDPDARIREYLEAKHMLLVLDGFERVTDAAPQVAGWLQAAPQLGVLVTSRVLLRIYGECEYPVPPLDLPTLDQAHSPDSLAGNEAVALFVERARSAAAAFRLTDENAVTIAQVVNRLDGLPLAIELAAARARVLTPQALLDRLSSRLDLLSGATRDGHPRHHTLRNAIDWSYGLLSASARRLFSRLAVFQGGAGIDAVEQICGPADEIGMDVLDCLDVLFDHSLVTRSPNEDQPRVLMLDTIREYAAERLTEAGETDEVERRHASYFTGLAVEARAHLHRAEARTWLERLDADLNNLRAALTWALQQGDAETAQRLVGSLWRYWQMRAHVAEGRERAEAALRLEGATPRTRFDALEGAGGLAYWQADLDGTRASYEEALSLAEELGDPALIALALNNLGYGFIRVVEDPVGLDLQVETQGNDRESAERRSIDLFTKSLVVAKTTEDPETIAIANFGLGNGYFLLGHPQESLPHFEQSLAGARYVGNRYIEGWSHRMRGLVRLETGDPEGARRDFTAGLEIFAAVGDMSALALHIRDFATLALMEGEEERALRLAGAVIQLEAASETRLIQIFENDVAGMEGAMSRLGTERAHGLVAEGRAMSIDEAVGYALSER